MWLGNYETSGLQRDTHMLDTLDSEAFSTKRPHRKTFDIVVIHAYIYLFSNNSICVILKIIYTGRGEVEKAVSMSSQSSNLV